MDAVCGDYYESVVARFLVQSWLQRVMLAESLADRLWRPWSFLVQSPRGAVLVVVVVYAVFLLVYLPFYLLSLVITTEGTYVVLLLGIHRLGRLLAQYLSYPGSFKTVQRDIERDYSRRLCAKLEHAVMHIAGWAQSLPAGPRAPPHQDLVDLHTEVTRFTVPGLRVLRDALGELGFASDVDGASRPDRRLQSDELPATLSERARTEATGLCRLLTRVLASVEQLTPTAERLVACGPRALPEMRRALCPHPRNDRMHPGGFSAMGSDEPMQVHRRIEELYQQLNALRMFVPKVRLRPDKRESGPLGVFWSCWNARNPGDSVVGLTLMRAELRSRFHARTTFLELGKRKLDLCVVPPTHLAVPGGAPPLGGGGGGGGVGTTADNEDVENATADRPAVLPDVPTVLFCNPNAGLYECANASARATDWIQLYTAEGCQVVFFNYRGYARSTGSPSPHGNSDDALAICRHLRTECGVRQLLVHGESIGGMAAAHTARHAPRGMVDVLVVDRTFANLGAVSQYLVGGWTRHGLKMFTCWQTDVCQNYLHATCPKLVCSDVDDQIIIDPGSLKSGLAANVELRDAHFEKPRNPHAYAAADETRTRPPTPPPLVPPTTARLNEAIIVHFCACLRHVARTAKADERAAAAATAATDNAADGDAEGRWAVNNIHREAGEGGAIGDSELDASAEGGGAFDHFRLDSAESEEGEDGQSASALEHEFGWSSFAHAAGSASGGGGSGGGSALSTAQRVWWIVARCDGRCGQLLGHATAKGLPWVRAWTTSLVVWKGNGCVTEIEHCDPFLAEPNRYLSVADCVAQLDSVLADVDGADPPPDTIDEVKFVCDMLRYLAARAGGSLPAVPGDDPRRQLGRLVPLHCGHNNPYSDEERAMLFYNLREVGWPLRSAPLDKPS